MSDGGATVGGSAADARHTGGSSAVEEPRHAGAALATATIEEARHARASRQAAMVYLHVAILYEAGVWVAWREGLLPAGRGPVWVWLLVGAGITAVVFWGLWSWRNRWFARAVWALHALRVPAVVAGAFFPVADQVLPPSLYLLALFVILVNLGFLARAGWSL